MPDKPAAPEGEVAAVGLRAENNTLDDQVVTIPAWRLYAVLFGGRVKRVPACKVYGVLRLSAKREALEAEVLSLIDLNLTSFVFWLRLRWRIYRLRDAPI